MKIDWKHLATTEGYLSLKQELKVSQYKKPPWRKRDDLKLFYKIIGMAQSESNKTGLPVCEILDTWEKKRAEKTYSIHSYYSDYEFKPHTRYHFWPKPVGLKGLVRSARKSKHKSAAAEILRHQKENRLPKRKNKPRWPDNKAHKKKEHERGYYKRMFRLQKIEKNKLKKESVR